MRSNRRGASSTVRAEIAQTAARFIAEGTAGSFQEGKRKAADTLGYSTLGNMPDNLEIQDALIEYQRIFQGDDFTARQRRLREAALRAMQAFEEFHPRLVGPVLYGSACWYSPVNLHLYVDEAEAVIRVLHDRGIRYRMHDTRLQMSAKRAEEFPGFSVEYDDVEFEFVILPLACLNHPPLSSLDNRPFRRAAARALAALLEEDSSVSSAVPER